MRRTDVGRTKCDVSDGTRRVIQQLPARDPQPTDAAAQTPAVGRGDGGGGQFVQGETSLPNKQARMRRKRSSTKKI